MITSDEFESKDHDNFNNSTTSMSYDKIPDDIMELVQEYCQQDQTPVSMHTLVKTGRQELERKTVSHSDEASTGNATGNGASTSTSTGSLNQHNASGRVLIQVANFLRNELPVRLAHRIQDLDKVPMMRDMPSVQLVKGIYIKSFVDLVKYGAIMNGEDEAAFAYFLNAKFDLHSNVLTQMARGAYELRKALRLKHGSMSDWEGSAAEGDIDINTETGSESLDFSQMQELHAFLDRFYGSRIGIRVLAGQYLALRQQPVPDYIGMICLKTSPYEIVRQAAKDATLMCQKEYGDVPPEVQINGRLDLTFPYIPTYLHYMLLELIKNAMRATVERHVNTKEMYPPVVVIIADGHDNEDVVIKIADVGGGIRRSSIQKIWSYLYTTASPKIQEDYIGNIDHDIHSSPLAGLGFGLPISRSYARYFNGDLKIMSCEGFGTDCYVSLPRLKDPDQEFS